MSKFWDDTGDSGGGGGSSVNITQLNLDYLRRDGTNHVTNNIDFQGHRLLNLGEPVNNDDAATKAYCQSVVDYLPESWSGNPLAGQTTMRDSLHVLAKGYARSYVPLITPRTDENGEPLISASSFFGSDWAPYRAFDPETIYTKDWATAAETSNFWLKVEFKRSFTLWGFTLRGRNNWANEQVNSWRLEGSNDDTNWTTLFNGASTPQSFTMNLYEIPLGDPPYDKYRYFRFFGVDSVNNAGTPGLSHMNFYSLCELV